MPEESALRRLEQLERELTELRSTLAPPAQQSFLSQLLRGTARFLLSYWVLLSFAAAVVTALYVKVKYEIDYFEQYREQATKKKLSELHRQLGDRMLGRSEWAAAAGAYEQALKIDPNNSAATNGLVKSQVFLPPAGRKFVAWEVVDVKLSYLEELFPEDYVVQFLKGVRLLDMGERQEAVRAFERSARQSTAQGREFAGAYLMLGYVAQSAFDLEAAIRNYARAVQVDPQNATAHNNLGFMNLLAGHYEEAIRDLRRSEALSPHMLTAINLGDAHRYAGQLEEAKRIHEFVLRVALQPDMKEERYPGGEWTYNFMPLSPKDPETVKRYVKALTFEHKLAIAHLALALDHALLGNEEAARRALADALKLERGRAYRSFYANKIAFVRRLPSRGAAADAALVALGRTVSID